MLKKCLGGVWTRRLVCLLLAVSLLLAYTPTPTAIFAAENSAESADAASSDAASGADVSPAATSDEATSDEATSNEETSHEETSHEETSNEETLNESTPNEGTPDEETSGETPTPGTGSEQSDTPEQPETPENTEQPETPEPTETPEQPETTEPTETPEQTENPEQIGNGKIEEQLKEELDVQLMAVLEETPAAWSGAGTAEDPYQITSTDDLKALAAAVNVADSTVTAATCFKLMNNIALTEAWTPIGTPEYPFNGSFDGDNKTISGLAIGAEAAPAEGGYQGLFGNNAGTVKNLTVTGSVYAAGDYVGGVAGYSTGALQNVTFGDNSSTVSGGNYVGGVAGVFACADEAEAYTLNNAATVKGTQYVGGVFGQQNTDNPGASYTNTGAVAAASGDVGGIIGQLTANWLTHETTNSGNVTGGENAGGIIGSRIIENGGYHAANGADVTNNAAVSGTNNVGGIVGYIDGYLAPNTGVTIKNTGTVSGASAVGGIFGKAARDPMTVKTGKVDGLLENTGNVTASGDYAGGIAGAADKGLGSYSYNYVNTNPLMKNSGEVRGANGVGGIIGMTAGSALQENLNIVNTGSVTATGNDAGGLVGLNSYSYIRDLGNNSILTNSGTVQAADNAGGIIGRSVVALRLAGNGVTNAGAVTAANNAGGLVGKTAGLTAKNSPVFNSNGEISATAGSAGGLAGEVAAGEKAAEISKLVVAGSTVSATANAGGVAGVVSGTVNMTNVILLDAEGKLSLSGSGNNGAFIGAVAEGGALTANTCISYLKNSSGNIATALQPFGADTNVTKTNCLFLADTADAATGARTAADFQYGKAARELGADWGQKIGADIIPYMQSSDHPAVYQLTVTQNTALAGISVKPVANDNCLAYDNMIYANADDVIKLKADGLAADEGLIFTKPLDRVSAAETHGNYTITMLAQDDEVTYAKAVLVNGDDTWGTDGNYNITNEAQLIRFAEIVNSGTDFAGKTVTLGADITLTASTWTPIGTAQHPFKGTFEASAKAEGGCYAVQGLHVTSTLNDWGLFGVTENAVIKNLTVSGYITTGGNNAGGLVGNAQNTVFTNCKNAVTVSGNNNVGGIAGSADGCTFTDCVNAAVISGKQNVGGIIGNGAANLAFSGCQNAANVTAETGVAGGIAGVIGADGTFEDCFNASGAVVTGKGNTGGVVGQTGNNTELSGCYNAGTVSGAATGGVAGQTGKNAVLSRCYNAGSVNGTGNTGGVVGAPGADSKLTNCYTTEAGSVTGSGNTGGVAGSVTSLLGANVGCYNAGTVSGSGANTGGVVGSVVPPIKSSSYKINGFYNTGTVSGTGTYTGGVFGAVGMENVMGAGLAGGVNACWNSGAVSSSGGYVGGVCGRMVGTTNIYFGGGKGYMQCCYNLGAVTANGTATKAGGVCGNTYASGNECSIQDCFNFGVVTAQSAANLGGISGYDNATITNAYYCSDNLMVAGGEGASTPAGDNAGGVGIAKTAAAFASGEVAYLLNKGATSAMGVEHWGQGSEAYPMPTDNDHPLMYKMEISLQGPAAGFDTTSGTANGVTLDGTVIGHETPLAIYRPGKAAVNAAYTLKDGYMVQVVTTEPPDTCTAVLDTNAKTIVFTLPQAADSTAEITFAAKPTEGEYTVTYSASGGAWVGETGDAVLIKTETVTAGGRLTPPENPTREGVDADGNAYYFGGWYLDEACTQRYNFTNAVSSSFTLYAKWQTKALYAMNFDAGAGTLADGTAAQVIVAAGDKLTAPADPTYNGFRFRGWFTDAAGTLPFDFDTPVNAGATLYAGWVQDGKLAVIFDANGGEITQGDGARTTTMLTTVDEGAKLTEPTVSRDSEGSVSYTFAAWQTADGSGWNFAADTVTADLRLTAAWTANHFTEINPDGEYEIADAEALTALSEAIKNNADLQNATFVLTADVELPADWEAISEFKGTIVGGEGTDPENWHKITINNAQTAPLFQNFNGTLQNVRIYGENVNALSSVVAAFAQGFTIRDVEMDIRINGASGAFVTTAQGGTFERVTIKADSEISGDNPAGFIGFSRSGPNMLLKDCVVEDGVKISGVGGVPPSPYSTTNVGVAGFVNGAHGTFENCYCGADITAEKGSAGGFTGGRNATGVVNIKNSIFAGSITSGGDYVAGLVARGAGSPSYTNIENSGSFCTITLTADAPLANVAGLVAGDAGSVKNSYWCGSINGAADQEMHAIKLSTTTPVDCYYGISEGGRDFTDSFDGNGLTKLDGKAFTNGEAAWRLDTDNPEDGKTIEGIWTQRKPTEANNRTYPTPGRPTYYPITVTCGEGGSVTIGDTAAETYYAGAGDKVTLTVTPDEYNNPAGAETKYTWQLKSVKLNDETIEGTSFTMPEKASTLAVEFELIEEQEPVPPVDDDDSGDDSGDGNGQGGTGAGTGTGSGDGNAAVGSGEGDGQGNAEGSGTGDGSGTNQTTTDKPLAPGTANLEVLPPQQPVVAPVSDTTQVETEQPQEQPPQEQIPEGGSQAGGAPEPAGDNEQDEEQPQLTVFELVQKTIVENPLLTALVLLLILAIIAAAVVNRMRRYRK